MRANIKAARAEAEADPMDLTKKYKLVGSQYAETKYVRADNTPENAEYLGHINGRELYPDFKWTRFVDFLDDLIAGGVKRPYPHVSF